jgi:hypothetical protein
MKKQFFFLISLLFTFSLSVPQQVQNGGFEEWELIQEINLEEPVNWSSIKTSTGGIGHLAPKVWDKDTIKRSGNYSVKLTNISAFNIVATGSITNGRVHAEFNPDSGYMFTDPGDSRWNTPISAKPDSLIGWFRQIPAGSDFATVKVLVHKGYAKIPDPNFTNWIGFGSFEMPNSPVTEWARFSFPIDYMNDDTPEYILIILTSGNGTNAVAGSVAWFDDLSLVYNEMGLQDEELAQNYQVFIQNNRMHLSNIPFHVLQDSDLELRDLTGRTVWRGTSQLYEIALGKVIPPGIYIFRMNHPGEHFTKKVFVR